MAARAPGASSPPACYASLREAEQQALLAEIRHLEPAWAWARTTLHRALLRSGITFVKRANRFYDRLREDPANAKRRTQYLKFFFLYKAEGRPFVFMDESWLNKNMVPSRCWTDGTTEFEAEVPPGKGARWILIGAGTKDGWIKESIKMWKGTVKSEDYHTEMNGDVFEDWMKKHLLPNVPVNACTVVDRASYHMMLTDDCLPASATMNRTALAEWLVAHGAKDEDDGSVLTEDDLLRTPRLEVNLKGEVYSSTGWSKAELLRRAADLKPAPKYRVHEWVAEFNAENNTDIKLLILPVAHPILNPIELLWGDVKCFVRKNNACYNMEAIRRLAQDRMASGQQELWKKSFEHTVKYAETQWQVDTLAIEDEGAPDPIAISGGEEEEQPDIEESEEDGGSGVWED